MGLPNPLKRICKSYCNMQILIFSDVNDVNDYFKPAKNSIRTADLYSSWFVTDNDLNPSTKGADLNLHRFKCV